MSMKDKAKNFVQTSRYKVEKATGKALGNEDMPAKEQMEELKGHLKDAGGKVRDAFKKDSGTAD